MKHFCLEKFFLLSFFTVCLVACGTVEPPETDERFVPDGYLKFTLNPNDNVPGDSIDANFAHGVRIFVHPKAHYELSFDKDVYAQEKPQLRLFRVYWDDRVKKNFPSWVRTVDPVEENGRYVYDFVCGESDRSVWVTSLNDGEDFYKGKTKNVRLKAYGSYSDHFSVNLIVAGKIKDLDVSYDSLARMLQHGFDRFYTSVKVDTVYVRYANEHPILGKRYSKSEPWIAGRTSDNQMMTELGGFTGSNKKVCLACRTCLLPTWVAVLEVRSLLQTTIGRMTWIWLSMLNASCIRRCMKSVISLVFVIRRQPVRTRNLMGTILFLTMAFPTLPTASRKRAARRSWLRKA